MIVVDAHQDIAFNILGMKRDYRHSALEHRRAEAALRPLKEDIPTIGLPDALLGRVGIVFSTLFAVPKSGEDISNSIKGYETPGEAFEQASTQLDAYERLVDEGAKVRIIKAQSDLEAVLETWGDGKDINDHIQGLVVLMEGADPITEPRQFEEWYERGVRIVGPAWHATRYTAGTGAPGPLTKLGRELLEVMESFNAILDLSHMAEAAFLESLDRYTGILIASHSNPRRFRNSDRHLSDLMIERLAEHDGVMGIVMFNRFLSDEWRSGDRKSDVPFTTILDAVDHVCQVTGSSAHVGIGSDFDGGFGAESTPESIDTVTDLWSIGAGLRERGYDEGDIEAILSGNWLRKLRQCLPAG